MRRLLVLGIAVILTLLVLPGVFAQVQCGPVSPSDPPETTCDNRPEGSSCGIIENSVINPTVDIAACHCVEDICVACEPIDFILDSFSPNQECDGITKWLFEEHPYCCPSEALPECVEDSDCPSDPDNPCLVPFCAGGDNGGSNFCSLGPLPCKTDADCASITAPTVTCNDDINVCVCPSASRKKAPKKISVSLIPTTGGQGGSPTSRPTSYFNTPPTPTGAVTVIEEIETQNPLPFLVLIALIAVSFVAYNVVKRKIE